MAARNTLQTCSKIFKRTNGRFSSQVPRCSASTAAPDVTHEDKVIHRLEPAQANNLMDIGIRKIFSEDYDIFRTQVRRFMQEEVAPNMDRYEEQGHVDRELWERAGSMGFLGVATPEEMGGIGGDILHAAILWEEQSYINEAGVGWLLHSDIVAPYLEHFGTKLQKEKYLAAMVAGKTITAIAMTEPMAGSDLQGIRTRAKKDGDDYILNGSKTFITNGYNADLVIVVAVTNPEAKSAAHGISLFLVEEGMPGFKKGRKLKKIGCKAQDTAELFFDDVRLSKDHLLGEENKGFYYLMQELPRERLAIAGLAIANAEYVFETTREYVKQRKAFGRTISSLQTIQHRLAELKTEICIGRNFVDNCLTMFQEGRLDSETASMAKYWLTDLQCKVADEGVQMHGGWGYMWEYPVARAFANARVQRIYGGSNEIMKELIARNIVKK